MSNNTEDDVFRPLVMWFEYLVYGAIVVVVVAVATYFAGYPDWGLQFILKLGGSDILAATTITAFRIGAEKIQSSRMVK